MTDNPMAAARAPDADDDDTDDGYLANLMAADREAEHAAEMAADVVAIIGPLLADLRFEIGMQWMSLPLRLQIEQAEALLRGLRREYDLA